MMAVTTMRKQVIQSPLAFSAQPRKARTLSQSHAYSEFNLSDTDFEKLQQFGELLHCTTPGETSAKAVMEGLRIVTRRAGEHLAKKPIGGLKEVSTPTDLTTYFAHYSAARNCKAFWFLNETVPHLGSTDVRIGVFRLPSSGDNSHHAYFQAIAEGLGWPGSRLTAALVGLALDSMK